MSHSSSRILYESCPLCSSPQMVTYWEADCRGHKLYNEIIPPVMIWKKCVNCTHVFIDGYFTPEAEKVIFSKTHPNQITGADMEAQRYISSKIIEKILPYADSGNWLDIGFGNGSLLFTAQEYGFTPVGVDLRKDNVEILSTFGIEAHCIDINKLQQPGKYSVVSMADVLEHMPYPKLGLESVHSLLVDKGVLLISMPNIDSILWQAMDKQRMNPYWREIEHYHNFGKRRLFSLLEELGFEPLRYGISDRYRVCMEIIARKKSNE